MDENRSVENQQGTVLRAKPDAEGGYDEAADVLLLLLLVWQVREPLDGAHLGVALIQVKPGGIVGGERKHCEVQCAHEVCRSRITAHLLIEQQQCDGLDLMSRWKAGKK